MIVGDIVNFKFGNDKKYYVIICIEKIGSCDLLLKELNKEDTFFNRLWTTKDSVQVVNVESIIINEQLKLF